MKKEVKFWLLFLFGFFVFAPFLFFAITVQNFLYIIAYFACLFLYCYLLYCHVYKRMKPKYPMLPLEGKPDAYTGANIPRPIYEDMEKYPWFFNKRTKKHKKEIGELKKAKKK